MLGASPDPGRYAYLAVTRLAERGIDVVAVGKKPATVAGVEIKTGLNGEEKIDTVTMYLNPANQRAYYQTILALKPRRIIFNPGSENPELKQMAAEQGILVEEACTLVMLSTGSY